MENIRSVKTELFVIFQCYIQMLSKRDSHSERFMDSLTAVVLAVGITIVMIVNALKDSNLLPLELERVFRLLEVR